MKTGNLVVTAAGQAGATGTTGAGGAAGADGVATTQNVASAINDAITKSKTDTAQAIADADTIDVIQVQPLYVNTVKSYPLKVA